MRFLLTVTLLVGVASACATRSSVGADAVDVPSAVPSASPTGTPFPWQGPGEETTPLTIQRSTAQPVETLQAQHSDVALPAAVAGTKLVASGGGVGYFSIDDAIYAVDLTRGDVRWSVRGVRPYGTAASDDALFVPAEDLKHSGTHNVLALSASDGRQIATLFGAIGGHVLHGIYYAARFSRTEIAFVAYDGRIGREMWENRGTAGLGGPPTLVGSTLLQSFSESGAITVNGMHGFEVVNGRERWRTGYGPEPLGTAANVVYLDSTWFPQQLDNYFPLAVTTVDLRTGARLREYGYKPDPSRNWPRKPETSYGANGAHVGGGYVYLRVSGAWYRYEADRQPANAHPVRLDGIDNVQSWLDGNALIVKTSSGISLARSLPDRLELHGLAPGDLRVPVSVRDDGTRYLIVGERVLAVTVDGAHTRMLGTLRCRAIGDVVVWSSFVSVRCAPEGTGATERIITFRDVAPVAVVLPHPEPTPAPAFVLRVHAFPVPPAGTSSFDRQWWPTAIVPAPGNSTAFTLTGGGSINHVSAIGHAMPGGAVTLTALPGGEAPVRAGAVVVDRHGVTWFNDDYASTVTALDRTGAMTPFMLGEPTPTPEPTVAASSQARALPRLRRFGRGIRIAIGPDGEAWYARSHPTREIGRVAGGPRFAVPDEFGDVIVLAGGTDEAMWFVTAAGGLGRVTTSGSFSHVALPEGFDNRTYPTMRLVAAPHGRVWIASRNRLALMNAHAIERSYTLPNASSAVVALTVGCDGTLYAADSAGTQLARIGRAGTIEEYATGLYSIDGLTTTADCRTWFVGGSNAPDQQVGTFELLPAPR
ncbi:MAG: Virginiamycin lyase [Candidatus Eremiobacteraeota bacterium]|nr:Virginiamycin lyase [Candidatus Eremiobacteraeota bacterium]